MKKTGLVTILLICCLGVFFVLQKEQKKEIQAPDFLPEDVLFYGEQHEFATMYQDFTQSRLGKTLSRIQYAEVAAALGADSIFVEKLLKHWLDVDTFLRAPGFNQIFGKEFSLALFSAQSFSPENPAKALEERLLLITRPRPNTKILQFLAPYFSKGIQQSTAQYGAHVITRYRLNEREMLSTVMVDGLVLAALDERLVRKSLDVYDNKTLTLAENSDFQKFRKRFQGASLFQYISLPALMEQGKMIAGALQDDEHRQFLTLLEQWEGWGAVAYGAWKEEDLIKETVEILYNPDGFGREVAGLFGVEASSNKTLAMLPADTLFYYWINSLDLPLLFELYNKTLIEQNPAMYDLLQQELQDITGMGVEEILAMVGRECSIVVQDVGANGLPLPKIMIVLQLKEPQKFKHIFDQILQETEIPINTKKYMGREISYWGIAPQVGLQPAFTLFEDYLLLSNSRELLKEIMLLQEEPERNLMNTQGLEKLRKELTRKNNSAAYIHIDRLADALQKIATWAGGMAVLQGPETARNVDIVVKELVLPLLDGVSMYKQLVSRSEVLEKSILIESTTTVVE